MEPQPDNQAPGHVSRERLHATQAQPHQRQGEDSGIDLPSPLQRKEGSTVNTQLAPPKAEPLQQQVAKVPGQDSEEQQVDPHDDSRHGAPAVRLDMDLDVDIQLKAKIKGDITLSIL